MSDRIRKTWIILHSFEIESGEFCVDVFVREDGSFGFEEFRRDSEDMGRWIGLHYYSALRYETQEKALLEAQRCVVWFDQTVL